MALQALAELKDFKLADSDQDCRGWTVHDAAGQRIGTVREMLVDTERQRVTVLLLDSGLQVPAAAAAFKDGSVLYDRAQANERAHLTPL